MAAKTTETAAQLAVTTGDHMKAADLYFKANQYFVLNSTPDRAAEALEKSAKYVPPPCEK
jgi:hypothetical protein